MYRSVCNAGPDFIDAAGQKIPDLLKAVLTLFPLDAYVEAPAATMALEPQDVKKGLKIGLWDEYQSLCDKSEGHPVKFERVERQAFYERAKKAYAVVGTGEGAYGNIILKKGCV